MSALMFYGFLVACMFGVLMYVFHVDFTNNIITDALHI